MHVYYPPDRAVSTTEGIPTLFLAGSIEMGTAENWQDKLIEYLKNYKTIIFNPRRKEWDSSWKQEFNNPNFYQQVNWELNCLDHADVIALYFDPNTKSPISLLELGLYASSGKLVVCCPDGFWKKGNVVMVCEKYNIPIIEEFGYFNRYIKTKLINVELKNKKI